MSRVRNKQNIFDALAIDDRDGRDDAARVSEPEADETVVAQVSLRRSAKERYVRVAREHGIPLSVLVRLAVDKYLENHGWD